MRRAHPGKRIHKNTYEYIRIHIRIHKHTYEYIIIRKNLARRAHPGKRSGRESWDWDGQESAVWQDRDVSSDNCGGSGSSYSGGSNGSI